MGMALFSAGGNLGYAAGPAVFAFYIAAFGLRATPLLAVPAAAVALVLFILLPSRELSARTAGDRGVTWKGLFADRTRLRILARLVFINFSITVAVRAMSTFLPVSLQQAGVPLTAIGVIFTAMLAAGALVSIFAALASKKSGGRALILGSMLAGVPLAVTGLLLLPAAGGNAPAAPAASSSSFSQGQCSPPPARSCSTSRRATRAAPLPWPPRSSWACHGDSQGWPWSRWAGWERSSASARCCSWGCSSRSSRSYPACAYRAGNSLPIYSQRYSPWTWKSCFPSSTPEAPIALHPFM